MRKSKKKVHSGETIQMEPRTHPTLTNEHVAQFFKMQTRQQQKPLRNKVTKNVKKSKKRREGGKEQKSQWVGNDKLHCSCFRSKRKKYPTRQWNTTASLLCCASHVLTGVCVCVFYHDNKNNKILN